jgi:hypothetical protein
MNRYLCFFAALILFILLTGCPYGYKYNTGNFPSEPVNFSMLNSIYDDYNIASPIIENERFLYFSSNRNSYGGDYDIVGSHFRVTWDKDEGALHIDDRVSGWKDLSYIDSLFALMNTVDNEFGPYSLPYYDWGGLVTQYTDLIIYTNDASGNLDLHFVYFQGPGENPSVAAGDFGGPVEISFLNSGSDDAYLTFWGPDFDLQEFGLQIGGISEVYFSSDRNGDFKIYMTDYDNGTDLIGFLQSDTILNILPVVSLNSESDDKCPFINGKLMVFASDRPGGYGGYDLYYSTRDGNTWSEPRNFGSKINTEYNEYRPIAWEYYEFENDLLMFSSDRPGGKGGYDLYYVGIPRMID